MVDFPLRGDGSFATAAIPAPPCNRDLCQPLIRQQLVHNSNLGRSSTCPTSHAVHPGRRSWDFEAVPVLSRVGGDKTLRSDLASELHVSNTLGYGIRRVRSAVPLGSSALIRTQETGSASSSAVAQVTVLSRCPTSMPLTFMIFASRSHAAGIGTRESCSGSPNTPDDAFCSSVAMCPVLDPLSSHPAWPRSRGPSESLALRLYLPQSSGHYYHIRREPPTGFLFLETEHGILPLDASSTQSVDGKIAHEPIRPEDSTSGDQSSFQYQAPFLLANASAGRDPFIGHAAPSLRRPHGLSSVTSGSTGPRTPFAVGEKYFQGYIYHTLFHMWASSAQLPDQCLICSPVNIFTPTTPPPQRPSGPLGRGTAENA